jgi:hypothetical protein
MWLQLLWLGAAILHVRGRTLPQVEHAGYIETSSIPPQFSEPIEEAAFAEFPDNSGSLSVQQTGINSLVLDDLIYTGKMVLSILSGYASLAFAAVIAVKFLTH